VIRRPFVAPASAKILYEVDTDVILKAGNSGLITTTQFSPRLQYEAYPTNTILARIFTNVVVRMSDVGTTFVATPQNDPGFVNFAKLMTDGQPQLPAGQRELGRA
jgi:tryptophanase